MSMYRQSTKYYSDASRMFIIEKQLGKENLSEYARVFGNRTGTGETIWF